ncbi:HET-domain-containing protein [Periconia macrospinosa]|uniref:HET-domain-containing protein n=1 Tax=Periconia macrospinosa TaxID=97972 RepID=A0A2V1DRE2_9PLEO|nr:HET-domain-containing protein [Periconia macrospinosa]
MRLLNTTTLEMKEFGVNPPRYAILSHTWGEDEATFQDVINGSAERKEGFAKVKGFCKLALSQGYEYAWIDTCCSIQTHHRRRYPTEKVAYAAENDGVVTDLLNTTLRSKAMKRKFSSSDNCKEPYSRTKAARAERAVVVPESTALSRDNLGSDNSENDPAGDSEAILTCVDPSGPLEKSFCSDDNASDDGNEASDGGNSLPFPGGHPGWLAQTNDTFRPEFPRESHQCCQTCVAMTGTRLGLSALLSDGGYVHLNWYEIQKSAGMGSDSASRFVPGRRESKELSSRAVGEIRRCLDNCFDKHSSCRQRCTPRLPRRVLDVGTNNSPVRLHQSLESEIAQYAALSYCWGSGVQQLTTTTSNFRNHMLGLPNSLPQTILDAVEVCRKIGIRYLWVDALCIIQDNESDKSDQIANMGSIYRNSTITIVVASAETVKDGFLSNGRSEDPTAQLPFFVDSSTTGTVYLRLEDSHKIFSSDEPIFQRAWTFQELLLSPRALVFDSCQMNFKCLESGFQSVLQTHVGFTFECLDLPVSVFGLVDENLTQRKTEESREYYLTVTQDHIWTRIIHEYSERDITFFEDRLPALAGIAAELAMAWNDVYLAGLWQKTVVRHLCWLRSNPTWRLGGSPRLFESIDCTKRIGSPSWSWITAPYPVSVEEIRNPDAKLVSSRVEPESQDSPFGQLKEAYITLEARILRASDLAITFECWPWRAGGGRNSIRLDFENVRPELDKCRLLYLGNAMYGGSGIFLAVEEVVDVVFRRVGHAELCELEGEWKALLALAKRELITIK